MQKPSDRLAIRIKGAPREDVQSRKEQYELLLPYYVEESERYEALNRRAAAYLSVVGIVSVFAAFQTEVVVKALLRSPLLVPLGISALLALLLCVLAVAYSLRIAEYRAPVSPKELVLAADANRYTSNDTYSTLLAGLVDSTEWNRRQNDKRATSLQASLWFAAAAVVLAISFNATMIYTLRKEPAMATDDKKNSGTSTPAASPAASQPGKSSMADLLNTPLTVPVRKSEETTPRKPPSVPVK